MQYRKISELKKLDKNPRTISKEDFEKLKKSITKFGVLEARPLILSNRTGELVIIGGNMRYLACKELGIKEVPTELIEGLSEADEDEIIIRDNVSNGKFDFDLLANEWEAEDLKGWGVNIPEFEDINFDEIESNEDRGESTKKVNTIKCPKCGEKITT